MSYLFLCFDVNAGHWLQYAVFSAGEHLTTAVILFLVTFFALYFILGRLWGLCWNSQWRLSVSPARWGSVGMAAVLVAGAVSCADSLYGGNFFTAPEVPAEIAAAAAGGESLQVEELDGDVCPHAKPIINAFNNLFGNDFDGDEHIRVDEAFSAAYHSALFIFFGIIITTVLALIVGVPLAAKSDIKEIKPL